MMRRPNRYKVCRPIGVIVLFLVGFKIGYNIMASDWIGMTPIDMILEAARRKIKHDTRNYNFLQSGVHGLEDLVMETGGRPQRTLIVSTWRSGSSFLGDLLYYSVPSTFYTWEPLYLYKTKQFRTLKQAHYVLKMVKRILKCNFEGLNDYLANRVQLAHHENEWEYCEVKQNIDLCVNTKVVSWLCKLFPFQVMKIVRLRLRLIEEILNDKELNMKVIFLIRDPRGVMQSRLRLSFCKLSPDCLDPSLLCADMVSDYEAARRIRQQYANRLMVIRFEELALETDKTTVEIFKFLKLHKMPAFDNFLESHTKEDAGDDYTTTRVSDNVPFKWKTELDFQYVNDLQMGCTEAMRIWGYRKVHNETHMKSKDFHPVADYTIP